MCSSLGWSFCTQAELQAQNLARGACLLVAEQFEPLVYAAIRVTSSMIMGIIEVTKYLEANY